jgi:hypothetical protein
MYTSAHIRLQFHSREVPLLDADSYQISTISPLEICTFTCKQAIQTQRYHDFMNVSSPSTKIFSFLSTLALLRRNRYISRHLIAEYAHQFNRANNTSDVSSEKLD